MKSRREINEEATRAALLTTARKHFARNGFSGVELGRIAKDARVTTGAIYHHFSGKKALFLAVAEEIEREIGIAAAVEATDPRERLRLGFERLIDVCAKPDIQRIIFVEAPQVIGPEEWEEIKERYAYGALKAGLGRMMQAGLLKRYPTDLVARTMLALLREMSGEVLRSKGDAKVRGEISALVGGFLGSLGA